MVIVAWRRDIWAMLGSNVQLESFGCVFIRNFLSSLYTIFEMNKLFYTLGTFKVSSHETECICSNITFFVFSWQDLPNWPTFAKELILKASKISCIFFKDNLLKKMSGYEHDFDYKVLSKAFFKQATFYGVWFFCCQAGPCLAVEYSRRQFILPSLQFFCLFFCYGPQNSTTLTAFVTKKANILNDSANQ